MKIKNFYTATSVEPGDVFVVTVKAMIQYDGTFKLYRCPYPTPEYEREEPQGDRLIEMETFDGRWDVEIVGETLFPILGYAGSKLNLGG